MSALNAPANNPLDTLILVDSDDRETGFLSKEECHRGQGTLHRAFSVFVFNREGEILLQQRSGSKPLWPLYWSNSCCSHPRRGEHVEAAARRRLRAAPSTVSPRRGWLQQLLDQKSGQSGLAALRCWSSVAPSRLKRNTEKARCSMPAPR